MNRIVLAASQNRRDAASSTTWPGTRPRKRLLGGALLLAALACPALLSCSPGNTPAETPSASATQSKGPELKLSANGCTFTVGESLTKVTSIRDGEHTYRIDDDPQSGFSHWMVLSGTISCSEHGWVDAQRFARLVMNPSGGSTAPSPASPSPQEGPLRWVEISGLSRPFGTGQSDNLRFGPIDAAPFWQAFPLSENDDISLLRTDSKLIEFSPPYRRTTNPLGRTWTTPPNGVWTTPRQSS